MDYFCIKWTTIHMYFYLFMDVLSKKTFMPMNIYLILGQD